jgi:hypothetical protein
LIKRLNYGLDNWGLIPGRGMRFLCFPEPRAFLGTTQPTVQRIQKALFPGVKMQGRESDDSPLSSAEEKKDGALPPLPIYLHGIVLNNVIKYSDKFTLLAYFPYFENNKSRLMRLPCCLCL